MVLSSGSSGFVQRAHFPNEGSAFKEKERQLPTPMSIMLFLLHLLFLALLTPSISHRGLPPHILGQWTFSEENSHDEELDELFRKSSQDYLILMIPESTVVLDSVVTVVDSVTPLPESEKQMTTREPLRLNAQDERKPGSTVWKVVVVVAILLVPTTVFHEASCTKKFSLGTNK
ncbi:uncharacterized protein LOC144002429 isoform X2 [Festucalex cinctus]